MASAGEAPSLSENQVIGFGLSHSFYNLVISIMYYEHSPLFCHFVSDRNLVYY